MRLTIYCLLIASGLISLTFLKSTDAAFSVVGGLVTGLAVPLIDQILANGKRIRFVYYSIRYRNTLVRVSFSYLFRIKVDDKYLLTKGRRFSQYQPIGGVYKTSVTARDFLDSIEASPDTLVARDAVSSNDLRLIIPGRNILKFVRWFESNKSRETSPWREFFEELVQPGIVSRDVFPFIYHDYLRREVRPLRYSSYAQSLELLVADIYELLPTPEQREYLVQMISQPPEGVVWVSREQIERRGAIPGMDQAFEVSGHSAWVL